MQKFVFVLFALWSLSAIAITQDEKTTYMQRYNMVSFSTPSEMSAYYYQNLSEFMPSSIVKRGQWVTPLPKELSEERQNQVYSVEFKETKLGDLMLDREPSIDAMLVIKNGKIVFEHFNMPRDNHHVWMSNAKTIAGLLIAHLEDRGMIDIDKTVGTYLPSAAGTAWEHVIVRNVLNMQSGIDAEENAASRADTGSYISKMFHAEFEGAQYVRNLLSIPLHRGQAEAFEYSSANSQMLGLIIAEVTGVTVSEYFEANVWKRIGAEHDSYFTLTPTGHEAIHGLFSSTIEDMARYAMLFLEHSAINTRIKSGATENIYMNAPSGLMLVDALGVRPIGVSYQWDAVFEDGSMFKGGMNGQGIFVSPKNNTAVVWFSNRIEKHNVAAYIAKYLEVK